MSLATESHLTSSRSLCDETVRTTKTTAMKTTDDDDDNDVYDDNDDIEGDYDNTDEFNNDDDKMTKIITSMTLTPTITTTL